MQEISPSALTGSDSSIPSTRPSLQSRYLPGHTGPRPPRRPGLLSLHTESTAGPGSSSSWASVWQAVAVCLHREKPGAPTIPHLRHDNQKCLKICPRRRDPNRGQGGTAGPRPSRAPAPPPPPGHRAVPPPALSAFSPPPSPGPAQTLCVGVQGSPLRPGPQNSPLSIPPRSVGLAPLRPMTSRTSPRPGRLLTQPAGVHDGPGPWLQLPEMTAVLHVVCASRTAVASHVWPLTT